MALLGGSNRSRGQAAPRAQDVKARAPQQGSGKVNLAKLKNMQERHASRNDFYKLNQNGTSRFRIVKPLGNDDVPMVIADQHFLPITDDTGKQSQRSVYCLNAFGLDCPICRLSSMLQNSNDADLIEDGNKIRASQRWAMLVVNRDYLADSDDPMADYDPKKEKIAQLSVPKGIGEDIIGYMQKKVWADPQDPDSGYDFEVIGKKKGGASPWPEYTLTPQPRDASPSYDVNLLKGLKALSNTVVPAKVEDLDKILAPILMALAETSEDGAFVIEEFQPLWEDFKEQNKNGITVFESARDSDPDIDNAGEEEENPEAYIEEEAAAPVARPSATRPLAKPAAKAPAAKPTAATPAKPASRPIPPKPEADDVVENFEDDLPDDEYMSEVAGDNGDQEGEDFASEGEYPEGEGDEPGEDTDEGEGDTGEVEEEPQQPVRRPAATPAKPVTRPAVARPAATATRPAAPAKPEAAARPAPVARPAASVASRLSGIGKK